MMRLAKKLGIGFAVVVLLVVAAGAAFWFFAPNPMPIRVDDPGKGGERISINGRPANFFPGKGEGRRPAILMLGGSEGGLRKSHNRIARHLQDAGFAVLYPGYYRTSEQTAPFNMVPLETFDQSIAFLRARDDVDPARIGVMGASKGAEAALLIAIRHPDLRAVAAMMPTDVVWQGFDWQSMDMSKFSSSWSDGGKPVPYLPYKLLNWTEWLDDGALLKMYTQSWATRSAHEKSWIRAERIEAPILLICGEKDNLWPSCDMARSLTARAEAQGKQNITLLAYADAGHMLFGWPVAKDNAGYEQLSGMGGTANGNNAAREDNLPKLLAFFQQHLAVK